MGHPVIYRIQKMGWILINIINDLLVSSIGIQHDVSVVRYTQVMWYQKEVAEIVKYRANVSLMDMIEIQKEK